MVDKKIAAVDAQIASRNERGDRDTVPQDRGLQGQREEEEEPEEKKALTPQTDL